MFLSSLPVECLIKMLLFLDEKSLYKCLFVNRFYCKLTIPIIWSEPFNSFANSYRNCLMISTLLACLNEEEISSLVPCAMDFADNIQPPLFEYGKFIRSIDHENLIESIIDWFDTSSEIALIDVNDCRVQGLVDAIYHMIMRQGSNLKKFSLDVSSQDVHYFDFPKLSTFMIYKPGITNLKTLTVNIDLEHNYNVLYQNAVEFLSMISTECNGIINCKWWINEVDGVFMEPLLDIVKLQPIEKMMAYLHKDVEKFFHSLTYRIETLKELLLDHFDFQNLDLSFLSKFERLESLEFVNCEGFTLQHYLSLYKNKLNLKIVKLWISSHYVDNIESDLLGIKLDALNKMVNYLCSEILVKLILNIVTPEIIITVKESCPNISFLYIQLFSDKSMHSIISTVCNLSSLKILKIEIGFDTGKNVNLLVKILGDRLTFVQYLSLNFYIDLSSFKYFTNNCQANLKKWKIAGNRFYRDYQRKCYLECVDNFQRVHNSLEVLGIICDGENEFCWTNEELVVVNSLNNQGVDIVSSGQLNMLFY